MSTNPKIFITCSDGVILSVCPTIAHFSECLRHAGAFVSLPYQSWVMKVCLTVLENILVSYQSVQEYFMQTVTQSEMQTGTHNDTKAVNITLSYLTKSTLSVRTAVANNPTNLNSLMVAFAELQIYTVPLLSSFNLSSVNIDTLKLAIELNHEDFIDAAAAAMIKQNPNETLAELGRLTEKEFAVIFGRLIIDTHIRNDYIIAYIITRCLDDQEAIPYNNMLKSSAVMSTLWNKLSKCKTAGPFTKSFAMCSEWADANMRATARLATISAVPQPAPAEWQVVKRRGVTRSLCSS